MTSQSIINRLAAGALAAIFALGGYLLVPPPRPAHAFEAQSTWGGQGGGTASAQTVTIQNVQSLGDLIGVPFRYIPSVDSAGPTTIAVSGLAAKPVLRPSSIGLVALSLGELQAGVTMTLQYNGTNFEILGPVDMTPIGKAIEFHGTVAPRGSMIEDGSCVSRTTFAPLFSVIGTNWGACDGSTTFGLPKTNGEAFVAFDNQGAHGAANRITTGGSGCNATVIGDCGSQNHAQTIAEMPVHNHGVNDPGHAHGFAMAPPSSAGGNPANSSSSSTNAGSTVPATTGITIQNAGSGNAMPILPPISVSGIRAIKF
jgi:microcystin-dependent protein